MEIKPYMTYLLAEAAGYYPIHKSERFSVYRSPECINNRDSRNDFVVDRLTGKWCDKNDDIGDIYSLASRLSGLKGRDKLNEFIRSKITEFNPILKINRKVNAGKVHKRL